MRDHDRRAAHDQPLHCLLDKRLRFGVEARGRLVQNQNRRICQKSTGQRYPLAFPTRELDPALTDQGGVALRLANDEVVRIGQLRGTLDLRHRRFRTRVGDVFRQRTMEEQRLLRHQRKLRPQRHLSRPGNLLPVDQDTTVIQVVEPLQQLDEGRLAGARVANQAHAFARLDAQREVAGRAALYAHRSRR